MAAGAPLLVVASLSGGDGVDATTVSFLLHVNLERMKKEEEKERRRVLEEEKEELMQEIHRKLRADQPVTDAAGRKGLLEPRHTPRLPALVVFIGSGMFLAGLLVSVLPTMCSLRSSAGLSFQASWLEKTCRTVFMCYAGFAGC